MAHHETTAHSTGEKTLKSYVLGLILCIILTFIAFAFVQKQLLSATGLYITLSILAIVQLFVQSVCFLSLNSSHEGRWNLLPFLFTILIIAILAGGSLWIMYNLNLSMNV